MKKILITLFLFSTLCAQSLAGEPTKAAIEAYNRGIDYYQTGHIQQSIESFKSAIATCPDFYEAYYNLGQIQFAENKLDDAIKTYEKINKLRPTDDENIYFLARALYKRGYLSRSLSYYKQVPQKSSYYQTAQVEMKKLIARQQELKEEELKKKEAIAQTLQNETKSVAQAKPQSQPQVVSPWVQNNVAYTGSNTQKIQNQDFSQNAVKQPVQNPVANQLAVNNAIRSEFESTFLKEENPVDLKIQAIKTYTFSDIKAPSGIAIDSLENVYVASFAENKVYKFDSNYNRTIYAEAPDLMGPVGIAIDKFDNLYVANYSKGNILKIAKNGSREIIANFKNPYFMAIKDGFLYISEQTSNTVVKYKLY